MTRGFEETNCTSTGNDNRWTSTTSSTYSDNYVTISTDPWNSPYWYDSKEYKKLIKEATVKALKESWVLKNTRIKRKRSFKVNRKSKIRNQLPRKIRKD
jgi:hypothetical protein